MELIAGALVGFVAGVAAVIVAAAADTMSPRPSLEQQGRLAELDPAEVARRVQGHEHAWELASTGRGFVRSERCPCGATRLRKGGAQ